MKPRRTLSLLSATTARDEDRVQRARLFRLSVQFKLTETRVSPRSTLWEGGGLLDLVHNVRRFLTRHMQCERSKSVFFGLTFSSEAALGVQMTKDPLARGQLVLVDHIFPEGCTGNSPREKDTAPRHTAARRAVVAPSIELHRGGGYNDLHWFDRLSFCSKWHLHLLAVSPAKE